MLLVAPTDFRPPRGLLPRQISGRRVACFVGPGRCVCRWAAARPRDRHTRACGSEWSISRPALALPPPTGTATSIPTSFARHTTARPPCGARPSRPLTVHAASFARRVASKPGQALQASHRPPIGQSHPMSGTKLPLLRTSNAQPGQNSPHTKPGRPNRYKTLPAGGPNEPTRYKTLPTHHKTAIPSHFSLAGRTLYRSSHQQAEQGELCTAHRTTSGTKPSPHETPAVVSRIVV